MIVSAESMIVTVRDMIVFPLDTTVSAGSMIVFAGDMIVFPRDITVKDGEMAVAIRMSRVLAGKSSKHRKAEELMAKGQCIRIVGESDFGQLINA